MSADTPATAVEREREALTGEEVAFALEQVAIRLRTRIEAGLTSVAIGQPFAREIVSACDQAVLALSASAGGDGWRTPPGWRLVPEEPTEAMLDVAEEASREALFLRTQNLFAWRLMLSAAPTPPDPETAADREARRP